VRHRVLKFRNQNEKSSALAACDKKHSRNRNNLVFMSS
jgi:hypothetical protein